MTLSNQIWLCSIRFDYISHMVGLFRVLPTLWIHKIFFRLWSKNILFLCARLVTQLNERCCSLSARSSLYSAKPMMVNFSLRSSRYSTKPMMVGFSAAVHYSAYPMLENFSASSLHYSAYPMLESFSASSIFLFTPPQECFSHLFFFEHRLPVHSHVLMKRGAVFRTWVLHGTCILKSPILSYILSSVVTTCPSNPYQSSSYSAYNAIVFYIESLGLTSR